MLLTGECKQCGGSGLIPVWKTGGESVYGVQKPLLYAEPCPSCRGGHDNKVFAVKQRANIPTSFYNAMLKDFLWNAYRNDKGEPIDTSKQKQYIDNFVSNYREWEKRGLGLYLWSSIRGTGKTYLASCVCNELMAKYQMVTKFVSASDLIKLERQGQENNFEKAPIDVLCDCALLVIDDLGQQKTGENWLDDILFRIIDHRYQHKLVTLITSNIELKKLRLDDRVSDRLNKMCQPIPLPNYSLRQKQNKDEKIDFFKQMGLM